MIKLLLAKRLLPWLFLATLVLFAVARPASAAAADTTPPVLAVPEDMTYQLTARDATVRMTYRVGVQDDTDKHIRARCVPRSGSTFEVGTTKVTCTAADKAGNRSRASFRITVKAAGERTATPPTRPTTPRLAARGYKHSAQGTELVGVRVTRVTAGAEVAVTCAPKCPGALAAPFRAVSTGATVDLSGHFRGVHLKAGQTVRVTTSGKGVKTHTSRIRIRANKAPLIIR
jgi:hypothetical protein